MRRNGWVLYTAVALGLAVSFGGPEAMAQDSSATTATVRGQGGERGRMGGGLFRAALEVSGLTPEQKQKLETLQTEYNTKMEALRAKAPAPASGEGRGRGGWGSPEMRTLMTESRTSIEAILTEEQKKELATKMPQRRPRGEGRQTTGTGTGSNQ